MVVRLTGAAGHDRSAQRCVHEHRTHDRLLGESQDAPPACEHQALRESKMRRLCWQLVVACVMSIAAVTQATAGSACCACGTPCIEPWPYVPVVRFPVVVPAVPIYMVNQGPN